MKILLILTLFITVCGVLPSGTLAAQNNDSFRRSLAWSGAGGAAVNVREHGSAADAIARYNSTHPHQPFIRGYRVKIFSKNSQDARQEALAMQGRFRAQFPGIPTYLAYEIPSWVVTVGNCIDKDEYLILLGRISRYYPSAFQWMGDIPIDQFLREVDYSEAAGSVEESAENSESGDTRINYGPEEFVN